MKSAPVYHITTAHQPYDQRVYYKECQSLAEAGYDVHYILPYEQIPESDFLTFHTYKPGSGRGGRFLHHGFRILHELDKIDRPGIVHFHDPDVLPFIPALKKRGHKVIFDVHEDYVKQMSHRHWMPKSVRKLTGKFYQKLEDRFLPKADAVIAATPSIAQNYTHYSSELVQNFPRQQYQISFDHDSYKQRDHEILFYGVINDVRGIATVINATKKVNVRGRELKFLLGGVFMPESYREILESLNGWQYTEFLGYLDHNGIYESLKRARVGVVVIDAVPNHLESQPNKLFEYMSAGLPVIYSNFKHWKRLVGDCGVAVEPGNSEEIAKAVNYLLDHPEQAYAMGQRGKQAVRDLYNWKNEERRLLKLYATLTEG